MFKKNMIFGLGVLISSNAFSANSADTLQALSCLINPSKVVDIASPVAGVVEKLYVKKGQHLTKGQKVLSLHSNLEKVALESAQSQKAFYQRKLDRYDTLLQQKLVSAVEKDELEMELHQAKLQLNEAKATLELKTIRTPIKGIVHKKLIEEGELVTQEAVVQVLQLNPLHVEVVLPQSLYDSIETGETLQFSSVNSYQKTERFLGKVIVKDSIIDAGSETFSLTAEVKNPEQNLLAGIKCRVFK